jgi:nitrite reductase/ring-hydroxylating ferredoxin subunit
VHQSAVARPPAEWTPVLAVGDVSEEPRRVLAGEAPVIVLRDGAAVVALDARCPHRGAPMDEGEVRDGCIVCPWHGSTFRVRDGQLVRGPSTVDLPAYECRVSDGVVEVRDA